MTTLAALLLGAYVGWKLGQEAAYETVSELLDVAEGPSWSEIQAEVAREGLQ